MIALQTSARDRRTAIIGFGVISLLLLLGRAAPAWYAWRAGVAESTRATIAELAAARATVDRREKIAGVAKRMELFRMEVAPALVNGPGVTAAAAGLASSVTDAATTNGVHIGSLQANSDSTLAVSGRVGHIRLRGEGSGNLHALTHFLASLEDGLPMIAIRELSITPQGSNAFGSRGKLLQIEFEVEALTYAHSGDQP